MFAEKKLQGVGRDFLKYQAELTKTYMCVCAVGVV